MTLSTEPFQTLFDAMHDPHSNDITLTLNDGHAIAPPPATALTVRDDLADESTLVLTACALRLKCISTLRDRVLRAGESWPPRRLWFDGFRAALTR
jgi:hypothetical protein